MENLASVGRYETFGRGRPVVILSNPQADPAWWAGPLVTALTGAGYRAVTFVHTGPAYDPESVARDVSTFLDHLGPEPVRLLGWSQGAAIAQEVALLRPDRVVAAALIAGYGRQGAVDEVLQQAWQTLDAAGPDLDPVRLAMLLLTSYPAADLSHDETFDAILAGVSHWSSGTVSEARLRSRAFIHGYRHRLKALHDIRIPCLVLGFGQDTDTFARRAREVAAAIPDSRYLELPDAGHLAPVTRPAEVIDPILTFFADIDAA
ncbi:alpha/beta fold hydrolase [Actinoplanes friuliensis]|uniref:Alpha/beta hydrolase fold protein n=1 Tax=Actinoplanes friuliensis DSM 7358 TaxID=1246995 RepID=U5W4D9_9ACTN|nr:alpha/beta hydrolase [Actinoplanes friuliensis]AGZ42791.1 alpha/beta hydrolase fold protein [Actinoplanes friuliensis DSM 7358]